MSQEWNRLSESAQLALAQAAMRRASSIIAEQAETLAAEMERGTIPEPGGVAALRLMAEIIRLNAPAPTRAGAG